MLLRIDPRSSVALFDQLADSIRTAVVAGGLQAGQRLPSARELAESLEINVHTVLRAYQALRDEGLVALRQGRGAIVTDKAEAYRELAALVDRLVIQARELELPASALHALVREAYQ